MFLVGLCKYAIADVGLDEACKDMVWVVTVPLRQSTTQYTGSSAEADTAMTGPSLGAILPLPHGAKHCGFAQAGGLRKRNSAGHAGAPPSTVARRLWRAGAGTRLDADSNRVLGRRWRHVIRGVGIFEASRRRPRSAPRHRPSWEARNRAHRIRGQLTTNWICIS